MNALSSATKGAFLKSSSPWRSRLFISHVCRAGGPLCQWNEGGSQALSSMESAENYSKWSSDKLVERVLDLERQLREQTARCGTNLKNTVVVAQGF